MALTWTLKLIDKLSGPARAASKSLSGTEKALKGVSKASDDVQKLTLKGGASLGSLSKHLKSVRAQTSRGFFDRLLGEGSKFAALKETIGGAYEKAAPFAGALASVATYAVGAQLALFGMAGAGIYAVKNAQAFKADTLFAFEQILGGKAAAQAAYDKAAATSIKIGGDFHESMSAMNALLAQGFSVDFADEIVRAMADLKTINPAANLEGITRAISQIKTTGRLQGDELMQLAEAGVNVADVYKQIAKSMKLVDKPGQTAVEQVQKLQAAGKVSADTAVNAIMASIGQKTGKPFGEVAAAKADASLDGTIARLKNMGMQALAATKVDWSPLSGAISRVMAAMSSPAGKKLFDAIGSSISKVVAAFGNVSDADIGAAFEKAADIIVKVGDEVSSVIKLMIEARPVFELVGSVISTGLSAASAVADTLAAAIRGIKSAIDSVSAAASSMGSSLSSAMSVGGFSFPGLPGRASGGPVVAGQTYIVGERGPELFTPGQSGSITPNGASERMMAAGRDIRGALTQNTTNDNSRNVNITANVSGGADGNSRAALISDLRSLLLAHV